MGKISKAKLFESSLLNAGIPLRDTSKRGFHRTTTAGVDKTQQQVFAQLFKDFGGLKNHTGFSPLATGTLPMTTACFSNWMRVHISIVIAAKR